MKIEYVVPHQDGSYGMNVDRETLEVIQQALREKILTIGDIDKMFELCRMWRIVRDGLKKGQDISDAHDKAIEDELIAILDGNTGAEQ